MTPQIVLRPRFLTPEERARYRAATRPSPRILKQLATHLSSKVSVAWSWYDQSNGIVEWTFTNGDSAQHSVVLLRNGYYFAGAFWPVYYANSSGRGASATNPADDFGVDWATALTPLVDRGVADNAPPIAIVDFGSGRRQVYFVFTLAPGESWSILEGGFSTAMTPSGISLYEVVQQAVPSPQQNPGPECVGYDPQRVTDWDLQTGTGLQGYSPNPSTFTVVLAGVESDAPYDVLPFNDSIVDGPCAPSPAPNPEPCGQLIQQGATEIVQGLVQGNSDLEKQGVDDVGKGLECLFSSGLLSDLRHAKDRIEQAVKAAEKLL